MMKIQIRHAIAGMDKSLRYPENWFRFFISGNGFGFLKITDSLHKYTFTKRYTYPGFLIFLQKHVNDLDVSLYVFVSFDLITAHEYLYSSVR
jgi:hypothetical protein